MEAKLKRRGLFSRKLSTYFGPPPKTTMQQTSKVKLARPPLPPPPPQSFFATGDWLTITMTTKNTRGSGGESADWKGPGERANGAMIPYSEVDEKATSYISHMQESFRLEKMYVN
ncbi:hypothetical protein KFK09_027081 [Dendrobium nobile]|uniref:Uncharacterized protein n=1 Tax=Dendrobium nobile TaxID=94219 RepID=A0A8T3AET8_DENNO|nr:hypothetical protein KFK09_027081 [Dendrobium nobile]